MNRFLTKTSGGHDELHALREAISCLVVLEKEGFHLDRKASSMKAARTLKLRRGEGEIIIVNHGGKGWWSPNDSTSKGDVIKLVQYLHPGMTLGHVRKELRSLSGISPRYDIHERDRSKENGCSLKSAKEQWQSRPKPWQGSKVWTYLTRERGLSPKIIQQAIRQNVLKEGPYGTAWFAHHNPDRTVTGIEMRGPDYRGFSQGAGKRLFRFSGRTIKAPITRLVLCEAALDALSFAELDQFGDKTLYVSTAGGLSPEGLGDLQDLLEELARIPDSRLVIAVDQDEQGDRYAQTYAEMAQKAGVWSGRLSPKKSGDDWNAVLRARGMKKGS